MRISTFGYSRKQGVKNIGRNKMFSMSSIATMSACIFLFGLFYSIVMNFNYIVDKAEQGVAITVFFNEDATQEQKDKIEFLCNECCWIGCYDRKACYETVSRMNLGENCNGHICVSPEAGEGYRFSKAMHNPAFISVDDIRNIYMPMGFTNFKIEGRSIGSALVLEFLLYYMTKPEYQINVREEIYLDNILDIF